jgi:hypothetical protein
MWRFRRLIAEVHRRSLWQVLLVYLGASYAILEAVDLFTERFDLLDWSFPVAAPARCRPPCRGPCAIAVPLSIPHLRPFSSP